MKKIIKGINIAWNLENTDIVKYYYYWIDYCYENNIKLIRIILTSLGCNALNQKEDIKKLIEIIDYGNKNEIEVVLVVNNFVDFNNKTYCDSNNALYSWKSNIYCEKYGKNINFFKKLDNEYITSVIYLLDKIKKFKNIKKIELFNEIDQVQCNKKILKCWIISLKKALIDKYKSRYEFFCSIADYNNYNRFNTDSNLKIDIHLYSFPYESAFLNIEYLHLLDPQNKMLLGEFAKNSDSPYLSQLESKIYFCSGIWASFFYNYDNIPLHWWWEETRKNEEYKKIINIFESYSIMYDYPKNKIQKISNGVNYEIEDNNIENKINEYNKIKYRLINLIKHPFYLKSELQGIKKYIKKKTKKEENCNVYKINKNDGDFYIEARKKVGLNMKKLYSYQSKYYIINLLTGNIRGGNPKENVIELDKGCYLIMVKKEEKNSEI